MIEVGPINIDDNRRSPYRNDVAKEQDIYPAGQSQLINAVSALPEQSSTPSKMRKSSLNLPSHPSRRLLEVYNCHYLWDTCVPRSRAAI